MIFRLSAVVCLIVAGALAQEGARCDLHAWADRDHFKDENAKVLSQKADRRVVFLGGSMSAGLDAAKLFPDKEYVNRSIAAQGTAQMLLRFNQDVAQLRPRAVVLAPGWDELAQGVSVSDIQQNVILIAQVAKAHNIRVVFASLPPINSKGSHPAAPKIQPERVRELNRWMFLYAKDHGDTYIDLWSPLGDDQAVMKPEFSADGVTLNEAAWKAVTPVIEKRVGEAMLAPVGRGTVKGE